MKPAWLRGVAGALTVCAVAVLTIPSTTSAAATKERNSKAPWKQEPDGFVGIKFGQPLPATIRDCPRSRFGGVAYEQLAGLGLCYGGLSRDSYGELHNMPQLGFGYNTNIMMDKGTPVSFVLTTSSDNYSRLLEAFTSRYGPPHSVESSTVQSRAGASYDNHTAEWLGPKVRIVVEKRSDRVDTSEARISDRPYWQEVAKKSRQKATEGASQL
ncbi:Uncharacterised protein [Bordetella ansorpii]|uniref:Uncharacterized protein n=1 Tax=Bordetella ansorpii TaxID=288768 RepID=A0A157RMA4_9BORD|nr:Uncharacterised protein [Bordetella ansorpii]